MKLDTTIEILKSRVSLAVLAVLLLAPFVHMQKNRIYESRLEKAVSAEPGIIIVGTRNFLFKKDIVSILRDPLARSMEDLLDSAKVPQNWRNLSETTFASLDEPFASHREREQVRKSADVRDSYSAEVAALYRKIEKLTTETAKQKDESDPPEIPGEFGKLAELKILRSEIRKLMIDYQSGDLEITARGRAMRDALSAKLEDLVVLHQSLAIPLPEIELHATPITGANESRNLAVARERLKTEVEAIKTSSIGQLLRVSTFLDNGPSPYGEGVYVEAK